MKGINNIVFATTNEGKLKEAREVLGIDIEGSALDIDEIQSLEKSVVAEKKARAYFEKLKKPILVEDVSLEIEALNNFPGTYINDFSKALGNEGICRLLKGEKNRSATAYATLVLVDKKGESHEFVGQTNGKISLHPSGAEGFGWDAIFIPDGEEKTFAEMNSEEKNKCSMRTRALEKFKLYLKDEGR